MLLQINIPNLFIIGAPRCGTSSMIHYLSNHPQIFVSKVKEPHYFNKDSGHRYYFEEKDYLNLFSEANESHSYLCEGSVWYMYSEVAIEEILRFNPNAKFIIMLRNPVSMFFSLHQELLFGGSEDIKSVKEAWEIQEQRRNGKNIPNGCSDPRFLQYGEACKLGKQAFRVTQKIPEENLIFVLLDDLKSKSDSTYNKTLKFLGVAPLSLESYDIINKKKGRISYTLSKFFIFITKLKKKFGIKRGLGVLSALNKLNISQDVSNEYGEVELLKPILSEYFKKDILLLEKVINKDLSHWKS